MSRERKREVLQGPLDAELLARRRDEGWKPVAVEWERDRDAAGAGPVIEVPYGLRVSAGGDSLRQDPTEMDVLLRVLADIGEDRPLSEVAASLNAAGLGRRNGKAWTQSAVFELLPRVIEMAPTLYASEAWTARRDARRDLERSA